jgi:hypothetical protein
MDDLVAFLAARLDEDEAAARAALSQSAEEGTAWWFDDVGPETPREFHVARHDPARVLREVEARREILNRYARGLAGDLPEWKAGRELIEAGLAILRAVLRDLAAVYSDHPDYRAEWKP